MFVILAYAPILMGLPLLLLGGVVFVVVPGGFIIVLGALYYAAVGLTGLLGLAAGARSRDRASRARRTNTGFENASRSGRSSLGPRGAIAPSPIAPSPVAVPLTNDRVVVSAPSLVRRRRGSDDIDSARRIDPGRTLDSQHGARPVESAPVSEVRPQPLRHTLPSAPAREDSFAPHLSSGSGSPA